MPVVTPGYKTSSPTVLKLLRVGVECGRPFVHDEICPGYLPLQKGSEAGRGEKKKRNRQRLRSQATPPDFQRFSMWNKTLVSVNLFYFERDFIYSKILKTFL